MMPCPLDVTIWFVGKVSWHGLLTRVVSTADASAGKVQRQVDKCQHKKCFM